MISKFRKKNEEIEATAEEQIFSFWMDYFVEATKTEIDDSIRFPVSNNILRYYNLLFNYHTNCFALKKYIF